jgi:cyclomaltodextrinase
MNHWITNTIFYHIYPLGCCGAPFVNEHGKPAENRLEELIKWIPYLKDLGVNGLFLGPLFASDTHGYDTIDYFFVDRRLGTNEMLIDLVKAFHTHGFKVMIDGVFNHTSRNFRAFQDIIRNRWNSHYIDWYSGIDFSKNSPYHDSFSYDCWEGHYALPKLNLNNEEVTGHIFEATEKWILHFGIDGIRLDAAYHLPDDFLRKLKRFCYSIDNEFFIMGEVIHGNYTRWVNPTMLDAATNYEIYKGLYSSHNDHNFFEIAYSLNRQFGDSGIYRNLMLYNFADNHDVDRVASRLCNKNHLYTLYALLFTIPGIPSLYYGSEIGLEGVKNHDDSSLRPRLDIETLSGKADTSSVRDWIKKLIALRKSSPALHMGNYHQHFISHRQFVFERNHNNETVIVALNADDKECSIHCALQGRYYNMFQPEQIFFWDHTPSEINMAPFSTLMLKRL